MTTNSGQEHAGEGVHPRAALIEYLVRYGGRCRDCADEAGFCPTTGIGCGQRQRAAEHFVGALEYGIKHGFVTTPETARIAALEAENARMREALQPFARAYENCRPDPQDVRNGFARDLDSLLDDEHALTTPRLGDLRRARAILGEHP